MHSPPPVDILWTILEHMDDDKPTIAKLCRVSRAFKELADSVLYRRIALALPAVTRVCVVLAAHPELALYVKHFETSKNPGWKPRDSAHLLHMRDALRRMKRLHVLRIHFSGPLAWILEGCYFSELRSMVCNLACDRHLASFFARQTRLAEITLSSIHHSHFPCWIGPECLPSLKRISADPVWLGMLVPNHPIADIDIWEFRDSLAVALGTFWAIDWLSLSLTSVTTLSVSETFLTSRGARRVASVVPCLNHLKIKCNTWDLFSDMETVNRQSFTAWLSSSLSNFGSLKVGEVILRGRLTPVDIEESLMRQFVVDASEGMFDVQDFIVTFSQPKPSNDIEIAWHRDHNEWYLSFVDE